MKKPTLMLAAALIGTLVASAGAWWWLGRVTDGVEQRREPAAASVSPASAEPAGPFLYDVEYPFIDYRTAARMDAVAHLMRRLAAGEANLELDGPRGVLDSLLEELDIDPASQALVFSTTSLQVGNIRPRTPRAIYFNDDVYVAWVQGGGPIEIASMDPQLGPVFYTLAHDANAQPERQSERCLRCHDSLSLTGGGVPRFIVGSGYIGTQGNIVAHEGWIVTSQRTPIRNRWGGWYVTGRHGDDVHLGNIVVRDVYDLEDLERLRIGNVDSLDGLVDTSVYAAPGSDIVALLVMQHQIDVQNEISRTSYQLRAAMHRAGANASRAVVAELVEPLVDAMLFVGEAGFEGPITGSSPFRERFEQRGPTDSRGRTLRELSLDGRLMRYPLSYQIYSSAFAALPEIAKAQVYRRLHEILAGAADAEKYSHLSAEDRSAILEILTATKPDFAAAAAAMEGANAEAPEGVVDGSNDGGASEAASSGSGAGEASEVAEQGGGDLAEAAPEGSNGGSPLATR